LTCPPPRLLLKLCEALHQPGEIASVISGQTANEGDCVLVGAHDRRFLAWQIDIEIGEAIPSLSPTWENVV